MTVKQRNVEVPRRPARDLIEAVLENMRRNLEPLKYTTLVPSRYIVYLHPREFTRVEGIIPILREETRRALAEELGRLNRRAALLKYVQQVAGRTEARVENPATDWHVEFVADPDEELGEGDILVDSELVLPSAPDVGSGQRTRRITTVHSGPHTTAREHTSTRPAAAVTPRVLARVVYEDNAGTHTHDIVKDSVTIGRGGAAYPVDIRIASAVDVSREHARIRRDPVSGRFFLIDLSSLGTTLNGRHVPRGYTEVDGGKRENGAETPLPDRARIGLADTVYLDFQSVS
jgi:pSer/pThr/pTyr-binding forkhead associated (FHA) protein